MRFPQHRLNSIHHSKPLRLFGGLIFGISHTPGSALLHPRLIIFHSFGVFWKPKN